MAVREAWGLDLGQTGLHAIKLHRLKSGEVEIVDSFFYTYTGDPESEDFEAGVEEALDAFVEEKRVGQTPVVASLQAFNTIFRDFPLPMVNESRLREIVALEAKQIIPFPLEETVWDFQKVREDPEAGEIGIALICCRRDIIQGLLGLLDDAGLNVEALQVGPLGLVNYVLHEKGEELEGPVLLLDAGAGGTNFVILNETSFWFRPIGISGADLTRALMNKFSIPFEEAEALKCKMGDSKQADRVFRVVEPALRSLVGDIQRSIGYYKSLFRGVRVERALCAGNTFLLEGVCPFLAQSLGMPAETLSPPQEIGLGSGVDEEEIASRRQILGVAAGLALQGLGMAEVDMSLLPPERRLRKLLRTKFKWAVAAVALLALTVGANVALSGGKAARFEPVIESVDRVKAQASRQEKKLEEVQKEFEPERERNRALAMVAPTRGFLLETSAAVFRALETLNDRQLRLNRSQPDVEGFRRLYQRYYSQFEIQREVEEEHLRKQIERRLRWKNDRDKITFLKTARFRIEERRALFRLVGGENGAVPERELVRLLEAEEMPAEEEDDEAYREGTVHLVAVTLEGFMVTRRSSDLNPVRERLAALPDIYEGSFRWNASPGTVANPKTNPIRLPQIVPPPKPPDPAEMAAERGREEAAPAPSPEGAEEVERISFENEKEVIVPFTAEYLVRSSVWRPEPEASAPAEEE